MKDIKDYNIKFSGLKLGVHQFDYQLDNEFFDLFEYRDFESSKLKAAVLLDKKSSWLELTFKLEGAVEVPCDLSSKLFWMDISHQLELVVKFGPEYDDSQEEILVLPMDEHQLNIAHYLYEITVLAMPLKRVHPEALESDEGREILKKLEELSPGQEKGDEEETDPRWDKLKTLLK